MPSLAASFGPWMCTSCPSNRIRPLSAAWVPATHLIRVDLPAPLSPTSAITSPERTSKSTPRNASTDPKLLKIPRSSSVGAAVAFTRGFYHDEGAPRGAFIVSGPNSRVLLAELLVIADADLAPLEEPVREELRVVLLRDPDRGQQDRLRAADRAVDARDLLVLDDGNRGRGGGVRLQTDRLVDRAALPAGEDELDAGRRRVLAGQGDRLEALGLERRDYGTCEPVVGRDHR